MAKPIIELRNIVKSYDGVNKVVDGIDLVIYENEFVTLLGASGCGKTTTLRMIAGFEYPDSGDIIIDGKIINNLPAYARPVNTVFQRYALFPHLNVFDNVAFGIVNRGRKFMIGFYGGKLQVNYDALEYSVKIGKRDQSILSDAQEPFKALKKLESKEKALKAELAKIESEENIAKEKAKKNGEKYVPNETNEAKKEEIINELNAIKDEAKTIKMPKASYFEVSKYLKSRVRESVLAALEQVDLVGYEDRKIDKMSGGQMQRVAIARAIILKPKILLLDEPLSALDHKLRVNMQYELKEMQRNLGITFIFVTHDQEEAMVMSDRIVVMKDGIIQQLGTPKDIYNEPVNRFVANFIGESNIFKGTYVSKNLVNFLGADFPVVGYEFEDNEPVDVVIRPEDWDVVPLDKAKVTALVTSSIFKGVHYELCVDINGEEYVVHTYEDVKTGETVGLNVDPYEICLMKVDGSCKKLVPLQ